MTEFLITLYLLVSAVLSLYAAKAFALVFLCFRVRNRLKNQNSRDYERGLELLANAEWPFVTTQLPIYNELEVVERVIRAAAAMDYPVNRHEIQVLDDSNDETCALIDSVVSDLQSKGCSIEVIRRENRSGYKAGALAEGMRHCRGELLAIFDADFVPPTDFLTRTVPHLVARSDAAWVQARWGHLNENDRLLTQAQALGIDAHFMIEQVARAGTEGFFMNFNGTAGLWRAAAIQSAGGWTADTLTEDLDLSYRAQLRGWKGILLPDLVVPGELPGDATAYKSQQFRWAKGSMQTALKLGPELLKSRLPPLSKLQGILHLTHYAIHPFILLFTVLSLPLPWLLPNGWTGWGWANAMIVVLSLVPSCFYAIGQALIYDRWAVRLLRLPGLILAGIGIALSNSLAVAEAIAGQKSPFLRTPKKGSSKRCRYRPKASVPQSAELLVGLICAAVFLLAALNGKGIGAQYLLLASASFFFFVASAAHPKADQWREKSKEE